MITFKAILIHIHGKFAWTRIHPYVFSCRWKDTSLFLFSSVSTGSLLSLSYIGLVFLMLSVASASSLSLFAYVYMNGICVYVCVKPCVWDLMSSQETHESSTLANHLALVFTIWESMHWDDRLTTMSTQPSPGSRKSEPWPSSWTLVWKTLSWPSHLLSTSACKLSFST